MHFHRSWTVLVVVALAVVAMPGKAEERAREVSDDQLAENAALIYWQAFTVLPELSDANPFRDLTVADVESEIEVRYMIHKSRHALSLLHRAASMDRAVWNIDRHRPFNTRVPFVGAARRLSRIALLRAKVDASAGRHDEASDDALAVMRMGGHLTASPFQSLQSIGHRTTRLATHALGRMLHRLDDPALRKVADAIDRMPEGAPIAAIFDHRIAALEALAEAIANTEDNVEALRSVFRAHLGEHMTRVTFSKARPFTGGEGSRSDELPDGTTLRGYYLEGVRSLAGLARRARAALREADDDAARRRVWGELVEPMNAFQRAHFRMQALMSVALGPINDSQSRNNKILGAMTKAAASYFLDGMAAAKRVRGPDGTGFDIELTDDVLVVKVADDDSTATNLSWHFPTTDAAAERLAQGIRPGQPRNGEQSSGGASRPQR